MTAHELKVHVSDPGNKYRRLDPVLLKPTRSTLGREWDVYYRDELVGTIRRRRYTPHTTHPGTRIRKDLAPRIVWDGYSMAKKAESTRHERRNDALFFIIKEL